MAEARGYILVRPTRHIAALVFALAAMWYAAASQNNGAAYLLLFLLLSIALVSIVQTWLNLHGLRLTADAISPTFAGQQTTLPVELTNESSRTRRAVHLALPGDKTAGVFFEEIGNGSAARADLRFIAKKRGEQEIRFLNLMSSYPLGFFQARRALTTGRRYLVYPAPAGNPQLPGVAGGDICPEGGRVVEGDDFAGVRSFLPGDSQRHIDWKAVARGSPLLTKQFAGDQSETVYLDWKTAPQAGNEERLSQLALWVLRAERGTQRYGLRLPGAEIPPARGEAHFHACLRALALFQP
jgi:uncharacterized protein (DUF58 family)